MFDYDKLTDKERDLVENGYFAILEACIHIIDYGKNLEATDLSEADINNKITQKYKAMQSAGYLYRNHEIKGFESLTSSIQQKIKMPDSLENAKKLLKAREKYFEDQGVDNIYDRLTDDQKQLIENIDFGLLAFLKRYQEIGLEGKEIVNYTEERWPPTGVIRHYYMIHNFRTIINAVIINTPNFGSDEFLVSPEQIKRFLEDREKSISPTESKGEPASTSRTKWKGKEPASTLSESESSSAESSWEQVQFTH